jgi:hypothetical protein
VNDGVGQRVGTDEWARVDAIVRRLVGRFASEPVESASADDTLLGDLGYSSLRLVELAFTFEELFGMDAAAMGEAPPVGTAGDLRDFLLDRVADGEASVPDLAVVETFIEEY